MAQYQLSEIKRSILFQCLINITVARVLYCLCFFNSRNVIYGGYVNMDIINYIEQNGAMQQVQHPLTNANENSNAHPVTLSVSRIAFRAKSLYLSKSFDKYFIF